MAKRPYEISLWTYNDRFLSVLVSSGTPKLGQGYEPHWYDGVNGEKKLTFTIPIKFYSTETKSFVNNELWYNNLKQTHLLANEKKVKLIFNKLERANNQYIHEIHEFVIENLTEEHTDLDLLCRVECVGAAFKELGKTGTELTLSAETVSLEEEKNNTTITPTANYWLEKVFPEPPADSNRIFWRYQIDIDNTFNMPSNKIYEKDFIRDWEVVNNALNPIYASTPIEKARFIDVSNSNKYNITQDIAEAFQVFVTYKYIYGDDTQPFKITDKVVLFYENALEPTEYSITYGNNELGFTRTSNSADVTTKMFVEKIESDSADDGFVAISKAQNNKHKDDFILNFNYFIQSGQLSSVQTNAIPIFERDLRQANIALGQKTEELVALDSRINILEADVSNLRNKYNSANDNVINIEDKITGLNIELSSYIVDDKDVLNNAKTENGQTFCNLRRQGVLASEFSIHRSDGTLLPQSGNYGFIYDRYGYVIRVSFTTASEVVDRTLLRFTYKYDLLSFYRNERATYTTIRDSVKSSLEIKETQLTQAKTAKEQVEADVGTLSDDKQTLIDNFNALMTPFLKEGTWNDSDYSPSFQTQTLATIPLIHDPFPLIGEPESSYMVGTTKTYYDYIIPPSGISADQIERLIIVDSFTEGTIAIKRELRYGAQYTPQFIYDKIVSTTQYNTVAALTSASPSTTRAYFVKDTGKVYFNSGAGWAAINPILVFVLDKDIKLSQAGHSYAVHTNTPTGNTIISIPSGNLKFNTPFTIAQRRWFLTENGQVNGAQYKNFQTNSLILKRSGLKLEEFEDYNVTHDGALKSITLKINNKVLYNATQFSAEFKLDVSSEQLYRDALAVSETSAFPEVSYDVSFVYLNQALNTNLEDDLNKGKTLKLGNIVRITDYDMQIKGLKGIVTAIDANLDRPEETSFTIQNYKTRFEDLFARIVASSEQMKTSGYLYDRVAGAFNPNMTLSGSILQQTLDSAQFTISSGMANGVSFGPHGILTETAEPYPNGVKGQTWITGGNILLSNSIGADGTREWTTALSPQGISASVIQTGRLDTGLVNIYSGDQLRFTWKADGIFAYKSKTNGHSDFDNYVKYNEDGLRLIKKVGNNDISRVEVSWDGFILRNDDNIDVFYADPDTGNLNITGAITATSGVIGGFSLSSGKLIDTNTGGNTMEIDPASGIYMNTTGEISMKAGTAFKVSSGTVQIQAGDASDSFLQFGNVFSVGTEGTDYTLAINSQSNNAIMINGKPVWHEGKLVVSDEEPAAGNETVWIKPGAGSGLVLKYQKTITSNLEHAGSAKTIVLANQTGDKSTTAGTYEFSVTFTLRRYTINQRMPVINTTGGSVILTKGGASLALSAVPALSFNPWSDRTVTVTGSTNDTDFVSTTGEISCEIYIAGAPATGGDDFIAHVRPSLVSCTINTPGGGGGGPLQPCEIFFIP